MDNNTQSVTTNLGPLKKGIIGGTGVYGIQDPQYNYKKVKMNTKYGKVEVSVAQHKNDKDKNIVFIARHGTAHSIPPHRINYRANIEALRLLGVEYVYATCAVGSCNLDYRPGDVVILTDFIDFTKTRAISLFDDSGQVVHTDMSDPYCSYLRSFLDHHHLQKYKQENPLTFSGEAVYGCTEGPRFETAAEIQMMKTMGCDVIGMTNIPEVVLAKEAGICYSAVGIITNWCTGMQPGNLTLHDIIQATEKNKEALTALFCTHLQKPLTREKCYCTQATLIL